MCRSVDATPWPKVLVFPGVEKCEALRLLDLLRKQSFLISYQLGGSGIF